MNRRLVELNNPPAGVSGSIYLTCSYTCKDCPMYDQPEKLLICHSDRPSCPEFIWIPARHLNASRPKRPQEIQAPNRRKALRMFLEELDLL